MKKKRLKYERPEVAELSRSFVLQAEGACKAGEFFTPAGCTSGATYVPPSCGSGAGDSYLCGTGSSGPAQ